ncbi:MAG: 50S ribosomal protein L23 [Victivallales bacterium]|nr:50S ribosomal protein L23 [Victivallales bacterium]
MFNPYSIIDTILITEKTMDLKDSSKYVFKVDKKATKVDIARAVENIYNVKVQDVNVLNHKGKPKRLGQRSLKMGRTAATKKAIVTLSEGEIEVL